jgi:hypothetical protein
MPASPLQLKQLRHKKAPEKEVDQEQKHTEKWTTGKDDTWCFIKYAHTVHADRPLPLLQ